MPVYEYKCKVCDEQFEVEQSFSDDSLTTLDGCDVDDSGQHQLKKVFRAVGISFKGDGFYRNDSRSGGSSSTSSSSSKTTDSNSSSSSESSTSTSTAGSDSSTSTKSSDSSSGSTESSTATT